MAVDLRGFDDLENDLINMANAIENGSGVNRVLQAGAITIEAQMKENARTDPKIITGALYSSIHTSKVRKRGSRKQITIGIHHSEMSAYYSNPVEYGHGGPAPALAHPFVRPAYDARSNEAYDEMKRILCDELKRR